MSLLPECSIVIFGATGDLAQKKLMPALYSLYLEGRLHKGTEIFAIGRRAYTDQDIRKEFKKSCLKPNQWEKFARMVKYHRLEFSDLNAYRELGKKLRHDKRIFYLATPQDAFPLVVNDLHKSGIAIRNPATGWHRVIFEKPFGSDLGSATKLNKHIRKI